MAEPIGPSASSIDAAEVETLRRVNADLLQKSSTRKSRIAELEANVGTITARANEAENHIRQLLVDGPVNDLLSDISVAPSVLRTALEADYKIELDKNGVLTLLNRADDKPVTDKDGKQVPVQAEAIKSLLLSSKDEAKLKLYRAIVIANKASGGAASTSERTAAPVQQKHQFGLR